MPDGTALSIYRENKEQEKNKYDEFGQAIFSGQNKSIQTGT